VHSACLVERLSSFAQCASKRVSAAAATTRVRSCASLLRRRLTLHKGAKLRATEPGRSQSRSSCVHSACLLERWCERCNDEVALCTRAQSEARQPGRMRLASPPLPAPHRPFRPTDVAPLNLTLPLSAHPPPLTTLSLQCMVLYMPDNGAPQRRVFFRACTRSSARASQGPKKSCPWNPPWHLLDFQN